MAHGVTSVVSLLNNDGRNIQKQYLVLPNYKMTFHLPHGSIYVISAKQEYHGTTKILTPDRRNPNRISCVFSQHAFLTDDNHGRNNS